MGVVKKIVTAEPVPRYVMPDASIPPYDEILEMLHRNQSSPIGSSYYYVLAVGQRIALCRIIPGGGKIFFHEVVDHQKFGVTDEDILEAITQDGGSLAIDGHYPISAHIDSKLRVLVDYPYVT